jgi:hypothetical protein
LLIRSDWRYVEGRSNLMILRVKELAVIHAGFREEWKIDKYGLIRGRYDNR